MCGPDPGTSLPATADINLQLKRPLATVDEIRRAGVAEGMRTLKQNGIEKVLQGLTDIHQVRAVCG